MIRVISGQRGIGVMQAAGQTLQLGRETGHNRIAIGRAVLLGGGNLH